MLSKAQNGSKGMKTVSKAQNGPKGVKMVPKAQNGSKGIKWCQKLKMDQKGSKRCQRLKWKSWYGLQQPGGKQFVRVIPNIRAIHPWAGRYPSSPGSHNPRAHNPRSLNPRAQKRSPSAFQMVRVATLNGGIWAKNYTHNFITSFTTLTSLVFITRKNMSRQLSYYYKTFLWLFTFYG